MIGLTEFPSGSCKTGRMDQVVLHLADGNAHVIALHAERTAFDFQMPVTVKRVEVVHQPEPPPPAPPPAPPSAGFLACVLDWLRSPDGGLHPEAESVVHVTGDGSDWNGDTAGGFYSSFDVEIEYVTEKGVKRVYHATGSDAEDLWDHVVSRWPAPAQ